MRVYGDGRDTAVAKGITLKGYVVKLFLRHNLCDLRRARQRNAIAMTMTKPEPDLQKILDGIHHLMEGRYPNGFLGIYRYAKWQAHEPIFKRNPKRNARPRRGKDPEFTCHQHIGRLGSNTGLGSEPEVDAAYAAHNNRQRLEAIGQALCEIQSILSKFDKRGTEVMPSKTN